MRASNASCNRALLPHDRARTQSTRQEIIVMSDATAASLACIENLNRSSSHFSQQQRSIRS